MAVRQRHLDALKATGVTYRALAHADMLGRLGVILIQTTKDNWEPAEDGVEALLLPVYGGEPPSGLGQPIDLVAFRLDRPDRWWLRTDVGVLLGKYLVERWRRTLDPNPSPIHIFETPLTWLRAGGNGICALNWSAARFMVADVALLADDLGFAKLVEQRLKEPIVTPRVYVRRRVVT